jgi:hypothetical protein
MQKIRLNFNEKYGHTNDKDINYASKCMIMKSMVFWNLTHVVWRQPDLSEHIPSNNGVKEY